MKYESFRNDLHMPLKPSPGSICLQLEIERLRAQVEQLTGAIAGRLAGESRTRMVRSFARARQRRGEIFSQDLFADPAWEILLELYSCALEQRRISASKLCLASGVSQTTALRWIDRLCAKGLARRRNDRSDGRRMWIELTDEGMASMTRYFDGFAAGPMLV